MDTFFSKNKYYLMEAFSECSIYLYCYVFESIIIVATYFHICILTDKRVFSYYTGKLSRLSKIEILDLILIK